VAIQHAARCRDAETPSFPGERLTSASAGTRRASREEHRNLQPTRTGVERRGWAKWQDETQRAGLEGDEAPGNKGDALNELQEKQTEVWLVLAAQNSSRARFCATVSRCLRWGHRGRGDKAASQGHQRFKGPPVTTSLVPAKGSDVRLVSQACMCTKTHMVSV
jgi:hypothetical protein